MTEDIYVDKGSTIVEQISKNGDLYHEVDFKVGQKNLTDNYLYLLKECFSDSELYIVKYGKRKLPCIKTKQGKDILLLLSNIHYLGKPHPYYKKRIQIPNDYKTIYDDLGDRYNIKIAGVYINRDNLLFTVFDEKLYLERKVNNSSAHVLINDLYQATISGFFAREDQNNNVIYTCNSETFAKFLLGELEFVRDTKVFDIFNEHIPFKQDIYILDAVKEMYENKDNNWQQMEWAGFYLEYIYKDILSNRRDVTFSSDKKNEQLDFDIFFNAGNFYGDLKASDVNSKSIICNDKKSMYDSIKKHGKLWYIIYEHTVEKDDEANDYINVRRRNQYVDSLLPESKRKYKDLSYKSRMKTKININKMYILELNKSNIHLATNDMKQGINSNGKERNLKLQVSKRKIDNFIIYKYER